MKNTDGGARSPLHIPGIRMVKCDRTIVAFEDRTLLTITFDDGVIRISKDKDNRVHIRLKDQHVAYKANLLGSFTLEEEATGRIDYTRFFTVDWIDDMSVPELRFKRSPVEITRQYSQGQSIELGIEKVAGYHIVYKDGVEAWFDRKPDMSFSFNFSTGFYGSFLEMDDGSYSLNFKGDRLAPDEDHYRSQSKFIVSRSKFTGKLLLILQDDAEVKLY